MCQNITICMWVEYEIFYLLVGNEVLPNMVGYNALHPLCFGIPASCESFLSKRDLRGSILYDSEHSKNTVMMTHRKAPYVMSQGSGERTLLCQITVVGLLLECHHRKHSPHPRLPSPIIGQEDHFLFLCNCKEHDLLISRVHVQHMADDRTCFTCH